MKNHHNEISEQSLANQIIERLKDANIDELEILDLIEDLMDYLEIRLGEKDSFSKEIENALVNAHKEIILTRSWIVSKIQKDKDHEQKD